MGDYYKPENYKRPEVFDQIRTEIDAKLRGKPGYGGIVFHDVNAGGVQVIIKHTRMHHSRQMSWTLQYSCPGLVKRRFSKDSDTALNRRSLIAAVTDWWAVEGERISRECACDHDWQKKITRTMNNYYEDLFCGICGVV